MAKKLNFNELIDVPSFEHFLTVLDIMKKSLTDIIALASKKISGGVPENAQGLKDYITSIKASEQAEISLQKIEQQRIKTQAEIEKSEQQRIKTAKENIKLHNETEKVTKKELDVYQQLAKQYNEAAKSAKALAVIYGINSTEAKVAAAKALLLNETLKKIDATVGQHQRNVGNYANSISDAIRQTGLFNGILGISDKITAIYNVTLEISNNLFKKKKTATEEATVAEIFNTTAETVNTEATIVNTVTTETQIITEKASKVAKEADTIATEANTTATETNKVAKLGWIAVAVGIITVMAKIMFSFESASHGLQQQIAAWKAYLQTLSIDAADAMADYTAKMQQLEEETAGTLVKVAILFAESQEARVKAMETDVLPERLRLLQEYTEKSTEAFDIQIKLAGKVAAADKIVADSYKGKTGYTEKYKQAQQSAADVFNLEFEKQSRLTRTTMMQTTIKGEIIKDELKLEQDASKQRIEMMKVDEDKKLELLKNGYNNELAALIESQKKLGDADGTSPKHASERNILYKKYLDDIRQIQREANEKQIADMQKLQDTLYAIELKTQNLDTELIHETKAKKLIASKDTHDKELHDIEKQNKDLNKLETELYKLSAKKQKDQEDKIMEARYALDDQKVASDKAYADRSLAIAKEYAQQVIDINAKMADEELKQQQNLLERQLTLAKKQFQLDSPQGIKKQLEDIQNEKDIAHQIELKKEEEYEGRAKTERDKITTDETLDADVKAAKLLEIDQNLKNNKINAKNEEVDAISELEKTETEIIKEEIAKRAEQALTAMDELVQNSYEKKQRGFDNEIDASKRHQDLLKEMAARGNQDARNNLAMEEEKEIQLQAKKEKAIQHEKQVEAGLALLKAYSKNLEVTGATSQSALTKTLTDAALLSALLKTFTFYEGTEDTGESGSLDSKGGKLAILHPHERVMTAQQNKAIDGLTNWELANAGMLYKKEIKQADETRFFSNEMILKKFDKLEQTIKEKPVYMGNEYHKDSHQLCEIIEQGNSLIRNHKTLSKLG